MSDIRSIVGGISAPLGFSAAGVCAGFKKKKPDLALIFSDSDCSVAGVFTSNSVKGWHVSLCRERLNAGAMARCVLVNSGNANACNGIQGRRDADFMAVLTAKQLEISEDKVFVCSTGTIGVPMPMDKLDNGVATLAGSLDDESGSKAAEAIMTTDKIKKEAAVEIVIDGQKVRIGAMAKGSGMIEPNMATMLSFFVTDAAVDRQSLDSCLRSAVEKSFNRISVDGDQSCNDTVLFLANGKAGNSELNSGHRQWSVFQSAVDRLALDMALSIVRDGEGANKLVAVKVQGAASGDDARKAVRAVARSMLVKTSWFGNEPNWGRVINAIGYSGANVDVNVLDISYDSLPAVKNGQRVETFDGKRLSEILTKNEFTVNIDLNMGSFDELVYTCDCSPEYVRINADYMS